MNNYNDYLIKMSLGFADKGATTSIVMLILLAVLLIIALYFGVRGIKRAYLAKRSIDPGTAERGAHDLLFKRESLNAAQIKVVYDLIDAFKRKELLAEAIPVSVLEHFAEYFYRNVDRLNISRAVANRLTPELFPLMGNTSIEIEILHDNKLFVFEKKVMERTDRKIYVQKIENLPELSSAGKTVTVSYITDKFYIRGESRVLSRNDRGMMVLSVPGKLVISKERRFSRVPLLTPVYGSLKQALNPAAAEVKVRIKDIGMEGMRVETSTVLRRNVVYLARFEDDHFKTPYIFGNFECTVTKSMISDESLFEYGMAFVYIDVGNRAKLVNYINEWVDPFKVG